MLLCALSSRGGVPGDERAMSYVGDEHSVLEEGPRIWCALASQEDLEEMGRLLEEAGYRPKTFWPPPQILGAPQGLDLGAMPDCVILDWDAGAPGELFGQWRAAMGQTHLPCLVRLWEDSERLSVHVLEHGAHDVLGPGLPPALLLARLSRAVHQSQFARRTLLELRAAKRLEALAVALALADTAPQARALWAAAQAQMLGATVTHLFQFSRQEKSLQDDQVPRAHLDLGALPRLREAVASRQATAVLPHELQVLLHSELIPAGVPHEAMVAPLMHEDRFMGLAVCARPWREEGRVVESTHLMSQGVLLLASALESVQASGQRRALIERLSARQRELEHTKRFLQSVISACPDAIVAVDHKARVTVFNPAAEAILGYTMEEALGEPAARLYPPGMAATLQQRIEESGSVPYGPVRADLVHQGGGLIPVQITLALLQDEQGGAVGSVGIFKDVRRNLALEHQLDQVHQDLERTQQRIVVAEMAGTTAHELNQPLTSLLNYAELLDHMELGSERGQVAIKRVLGEVNRMAEIVRRIGRITQYRTREYVGEARIMDLTPETD